MRRMQIDSPTPCHGKDQGGPVTIISELCFYDYANAIAIQLLLCNRSNKISARCRSIRIFHSFFSHFTTHDNQDEVSENRERFLLVAFCQAFYYFCVIPRDMREGG